MKITLKSILILTAVTCLSVNYSYGQLGKLKSKVKTKTNSVVKKSDSSTKSNSSNSNSSSNSSISMESPAKSEISRFKSALKNGKNYVSRELETINGGSSSNKQYAEEKLNDCQTNLEKIKNF